MNYYEELGLHPEASVQEIRQAYKVLARLVHPDGHPDEPVRAMAERQMKRLNEILATLTDTHKRRMYDDSLSASPAALETAVPTVNVRAAHAAVYTQGLHRKPAVRLRPQPEPWRTRIPDWANVALGYWFWIVLAAVILGVGVWCLTAGNSKPTAETTRAPLASEPGPVARPAPPPRLAVSQASADVPQPLKSDAASSPEAAPPVVGEDPLPREVAKLKDPSGVAAPESHAAASVAAKPEPASTLLRPQTPPNSFAGNWLYLPDSADASAPGAYPATYIEFLLTEQYGELSGNYRARYKVSNLAVSPEIQFRVQGKSPAGESVTLGWTSTDGARGEVEMTLRGSGGMTVNWWTTELGRHPALASGTAKLVRQRIP